MLRTNLSTRPFYNERAVRAGIAMGVVVVAALTAFNVLQVASLNRRNLETATRAEEAERQTAHYRQQAQAIRQALNTGDVSVVQQAAREANLLIDRRVFSWTDLFNRFEQTLPNEVRITAVEPQVDRDRRLLLNVTVIARRVEDLNAFMDQLELSGGLQAVIARQDETLGDGTLRAIIQGYYVPKAEAPTGTGAAASDSIGQPENESSTAPDPPSAPRGDLR